MLTIPGPEEDRGGYPYGSGSGEHVARDGVLREPGRLRHC